MRAHAVERHTDIKSDDVTSWSYKMWAQELGRMNASNVRRSGAR